MFRLALAHGTLLNLVLIAAAIRARLDLIRFGRVTSLGLRAAVVLLPGGFLLGGIWHFKDNPGVAILLVPVGAVLLLTTALQIGCSVWRRYGNRTVIEPLHLKAIEVRTPKERRL